MSTSLATAEEYLSPVKYKMDIMVPDESSTTYTYNGFDTDHAPFALTDIDVNLGQGQTGTFQIKIDDTKDKVLRNTIDCGCVVIIKAAKNESRFRNIMTGIIDDIQDDYPLGDKLVYTYSGLGIGVILNYTILNLVKSANKEDLLSGSFVVKDPTFRVDNLAHLVFESTDVLPVANAPLLKDRGDFVLNGISDRIREFIPAVNAPLATASSIMEVLASASGTIFWIDPDRNVILRPSYQKHSGITVRQWEVDPITKLPLRQNDSADYTSYYFGGWSSRKTMKPESGFFNKVFLVINVDEVVKGSSSSDAPNFTSLANRDVGQQFIPGSTKLFNLCLLLSKKGTGRSSVEDAFDLTGVNGLICEDDGGNNPGPKIVATFTIPYDRINTGPTPVYNIDLKYKVSSVDQAKKHWIILFKCGVDEENTILWYHDSDTTTASSSQTPRYSGTKRPFTKQPIPSKEEFSEGFKVNSAGPVYRHSFFVTNKTTLTISDPISIKKYTPNRPVAVRVNAPWITDISTGMKFANVLLSYGAKLKRIYEKKQVSIPDKLFDPLTLINIVYPPAGIDMNSNTIAEVNNIRYRGSGFDTTNPYGSYFVELTAVGYVNHYQNRVGSSIVCSS